MFVPVAQLDRVFGYEPKGQGFESLQARQRKASKLLKFRGFCYADAGKAPRKSATLHQAFSWHIEAASQKKRGASGMASGHGAGLFSATAVFSRAKARSCSGRGHFIPQLNFFSYSALVRAFVFIFSQSHNKYITLTKFSPLLYNYIVDRAPVKPYFSICCIGYFRGHRCHVRSENMKGA